MSRTCHTYVMLCDVLCVYVYVMSHVHVRVLCVYVYVMSHVHVRVLCVYVCVGAICAWCVLYVCV